MATTKPAVGLWRCTWLTNDPVIAKRLRAIDRECARDEVRRGSPARPIVPGEELPVGQEHHAIACPAKPTVCLEVAIRLDDRGRPCAQDAVSVMVSFPLVCYKIIIDVLRFMS